MPWTGKRHSCNNFMTLTYPFLGQRVAEPVRNMVGLEGDHHLGAIPNGGRDPAPWFSSNGQSVD